MDKEPVGPWIALLREEVQTYRNRSREAVVSFGGLCVAITYFVLDQKGLPPATLYVIAGALVFAVVIVHRFLKLSRQRGEDCRERVKKLVDKLEEPYRSFTLELKSPRGWMGSVTNLYVYLVVLFAVVTLALTFGASQN